MKARTSLNARLPRIEEEPAAPRTFDWGESTSGYYHQDQRDLAATVGCLSLVVAALAVIALVIVACLAPAAEEKPMDGSTAGSNAVTIEELRARGGEVRNHGETGE